MLIVVCCHHPSIIVTYTRRASSRRHHGIVVVSVSLVFVFILYNRWQLWTISIWHFNHCNTTYPCMMCTRTGIILHTYHTYHTIPYHIIPYIPYHIIPYHIIHTCSVPVILVHWTYTTCTYRQSSYYLVGLELFPRGRAL